jgi:hypothetical protein
MQTKLNKIACVVLDKRKMLSKGNYSHESSTKGALKAARLEFE